MIELSTLQKIAVIIPPFVLAVVVHEAAHGWVADKLGDPTARKMGRITLNPFPHIDPFNTIILPILLYLASGIIFGSAKPVPINPYNFRKPKRDMAFSSLAGPTVNILMAALFAFILRFAISPLEGNIPEGLWGWLIVPLSLMLTFGVLINVVLAVLNLLPIPPLDGSRIVYWLLPEKQGMAYYRLEPYGIFIILILFWLNILGKIVLPIIRPILHVLLGHPIL
jgi:Zn-dependent protease